MQTYSPIAGINIYKVGRLCIATFNDFQSASISSGNIVLSKWYPNVSLELAACAARTNGNCVVSIRQTGVIEIFDSAVTRTLTDDTIFGTVLYFTNE